MTGPRKPDEAALGGADAVPDTPDVAAHGTNPGPASGGQPLARVGAGGGPPAIAWIAGLLALIVALVVGFGIFR